MLWKAVLCPFSKRNQPLQHSFLLPCSIRCGRTDIELSRPPVDDQQVPSRHCRSSPLCFCHSWRSCHCTLHGSALPSVGSQTPARSHWIGWRLGNPQFQWIVMSLMYAILEGILHYWLTKRWQMGIGLWFGWLPESAGVANVFHQARVHSKWWSEASIA